MPFYLALDVGGTKTEYVLADDTHELARVRGGTIKLMRIDAATASDHLDQALAQLTAMTGISMQSVTRTCVGAAGFSVPLVADWIRDALRTRVSGPLFLVGDVEIALDAAFPGSEGIVIIAGTGSNVAGRTAAGEITTAGGWGPALADQASGHRIGYNALRDTFLALDERRTTTLLPALLELWRLPTLAALISFSNQIPPPDLSRLAPVVAQCAAAGDAVAQNVLSREAEEMAHLAHLVFTRLLQARPIQEARPAQPNSHTIPPLPGLAFTGSILEHVAPIREGIIRALRRDLPSLTVLPGVVDPILGALWRARTG